MINNSTNRLRVLAYWSSNFWLLALIILCLLWELQIAPIRPGGSWLVLKIVPILFVVFGILKQNIKTYQASTLLIWLYFAEGATRAFSDPTAMSRLMASFEIVICICFFVSTVAYIRTFKRKPTQGKKGSHEYRQHK